MLHAMKKRDFARACVLFKRMRNVNARNAHGATVLHTAAWCRRSEFVEFLCTHRCIDVDARDRHESTALHGAAVNLDLSSIRHLLIAGADPCALSTHGRTVLHFFALGVFASGQSRRKRLGMLVLHELLCVYTVDIEAVTEFNETARDVLVKAKADDLLDCLDREVRAHVTA